MDFPLQPLSEAGQTFVRLCESHEQDFFSRAAKNDREGRFPDENTAGHRQVVGPWPRWCTRSGRVHGSLRYSGNPGDFGPGLEGLGPGGSILGGGKVIAAEMKEVVDLIVGGEETLNLSG
jgi:hypothetical protein